MLKIMLKASNQAFEDSGLKQLIALNFRTTGEYSYEVLEELGASGQNIRICIFFKEKQEISPECQGNLLRIFGKYSNFDLEGRTYKHVYGSKKPTPELEPLDAGAAAPAYGGPKKLEIEVESGATAGAASKTKREELLDSAEAKKCYEKKWISREDLDKVQEVEKIALLLTHTAMQCYEAHHFTPNDLKSFDIYKIYALTTFDAYCSYNYKRADFAEIKDFSAQMVHCTMLPKQDFVYQDPITSVLRTVVLPIDVFVPYGEGNLALITDMEEAKLSCSINRC
jgi:hypothetical protein